MNYELVSFYSVQQASLLFIKILPFYIFKITFILKVCEVLLLLLLIIKLALFSYLTCSYFSSRLIQVHLLAWFLLSSHHPPLYYAGDAVCSQPPRCRWKTEADVVLQSPIFIPERTPGIQVPLKFEKQPAGEIPSLLYKHKRCKKSTAREKV